MRPPKKGERPSSYDREAPADSAVQEKRALWPSFADGYTDEVQGKTETSLEAGGAASYADLSAVEIAELHYLYEKRTAAEKRVEVMSDLLDKLDASRPKTARTIAAKTSRMSNLDRRIRAKEKEVLDITKLIASKSRHLRLIVEKSGGGAESAKRVVAVPVEMAEKIRTVGEEYDDDFDIAAPVLDPSELQ